MRNRDAYQRYCEDIARLCILLNEAQRRGLLEWSTSKRTRPDLRLLREIGLSDGFSKRELEDRKRWAEAVSGWIPVPSQATSASASSEGRPFGLRGKLLWNEEAKARQAGRALWALAGQLVAKPRFLNDVLHALDRGDETYFLFLTEKVSEINQWLSDNDLVWFEFSPQDIPDERERIRKAWPWQGERAIREAKRREAREALKRPPSLVDSGESENALDEAARQQYLKEIDDYFDFCRRWEFQNKIKSWRDAERVKQSERNAQNDEKRDSRSGRDNRPALEELVYNIFKAGSDHADDAVSRLAQLLFNSPRDQSKLALLLGMTPSQWLVQEERESIRIRRALHFLFEGPANESAAQAADTAGECRTKNAVSAGQSDDKLLQRALTGVCFSGGGIRSATFNLGVMQALAELNLLRCFDYLSSVSGGSYIHQWIAAWWRRAADVEPADRAFQTVNKSIVSQPASTLPGIEATQVSFLRRFSNYLTPRKGVLSADSWTIIAVWLRNTFLNQFVLAMGLLSLFAILRSLLVALDAATDPGSAGGRHFITASLGFFLLFLLYIVWRLHEFTRNLDRGAVSHSARLGDGAMALAVTLGLISALLYTGWCIESNFSVPAINEHFSSWLFDVLPRREVRYLMFPLVLWPLCISLIGFTPRLYKGSHPRRSVLLLRIRLAATALFSGTMVLVALVFLFFHLSKWLLSLWCNAQCCNQAGIVGALASVISAYEQFGTDLLFMCLPPVLLAALFLTSVLQIGLNRNIFRDEALEWMARTRAWGCLISMAWLAVVGCLVLSRPLLIFAASLRHNVVATTIWAAISAGGAWAASLKAPSESRQLRAIAQKALVQTAPYIFIAGLLIGVSAGLNVITGYNPATLPRNLAIVGTISTILFALYGWNVDINEFSMHSFYRNRLARCYQGASVVDRKPDQFTGFSRDDRAVRLGQLRVMESAGEDGANPYPGPFPIFCCTATFSAGEDLAWQERKGASFAFTPLYSGYDIPWTGLDRKGDARLFYSGFRDTRDLGHPDGPGLADVSAISGAAVSPNRGFQTSPGSAFLMTCFNVRLGAWKRNTRRAARDDADRRRAGPSKDYQSPRFAPVHLLKELFGQTDAKDEYLYLTDGGHFDNMGLYELVRRNCQYIVICDAEQDRALQFEGIAMALRKCRTDFGVEIDLDLRAMRKAADTGWSGVHCVVGTILYPNQDPDTPGRDRGKIVYLKSTLTGAEPADLLSYKLEHPAFPHDSTGDQWFSESQFESYRVLGRWIALTAMKPACEKEEHVCGIPEAAREFFNRLYDVWYPVTPAIEDHLHEHGVQFDQLLRELRSKDAYAAHCNQLFKLGQSTLPGTTAEQEEYLRAFALSLFDFMWRVFTDLDLQLASNRAHPHGEIWMRTFRRWTEMDFVRQAWPIYNHRYPAGFHFFLREHLDLREPVS